MLTKKYFSLKYLFLVFTSIIHFFTQAQTASLSGQVTSNNTPIKFANILLKEISTGVSTDTMGRFSLKNILPGSYTIVASAIGYSKAEQSIILQENEAGVIHLELTISNSTLNEVVISGTMKEISRLQSPVPVEVYSAKFFKSNPTPSLFDALQNINGVRPQLNCNVCNTGDIHINGLEGPYTMVLIDGMPIVSGLSTVYGLSGIPQSLIDRVEIVKGPASTLYGSEAVGGLINIITQKPTSAPLLLADVFATSWGEVNADLAGKFSAGSKTQSLIGLNYFNYSNTIDNNKDGFTDLTLQKRISFFNKWHFERKDNRLFSIAGRYVYEDRWGGDINWSKKFRGGDSIYGESIYIKRWELFGTYQLPLKEKILVQFSINDHDQNSVYGNIPYLAQQYVGFGQLTWSKQFHVHDLLLGSTFRYTYYDDNTPATTKFNSADSSVNLPAHTYLPGIFVQDEININENNTLLIGIRYDYNSIHGNILTPRINYKWNSKNRNNVLRFSIGNGYRVANVFTEDHAALTGARQVLFLSDLKPETSWNVNINLVKKILAANGAIIGIDASTFYTFFTNKIIANYDTDPNKIIYDNIEGYAVSKGLSLNLDVSLKRDFKFLLGATYMDVYSVKNRLKAQQLFTEKFTGVWSIGYTLSRAGLVIDYTGNIYSPMRLPLLSNTDPRREYAPWWSIQNIQLTKKIKQQFEVYGGIKNLLNWTPNKGNPFIIARANDPFDKQVAFDASGKAMITANNPHGLTFDPTYVYGPNQGIRGFIGLRYTLKKTP